MHTFPSALRRRGRALAALAVTATAVSTAYAVAAPPAHADSGTLSGVVAKGGPTQAAAYGAWRGRKVDVVTDFLGGNSWTSIANTRWAGIKWQGTAYHVVFSLPMLPFDHSGTLAEGATGAYNGYFRSAAQGLVDTGQGDATIRLGWELTGDWYPWAALKDPSSFAAYWRQIVTTMRSVPGAKFTFDFNISDQRLDPRAAWPGDAYVDYVGGDFYDQSYSSDYSPTDHAKVWDVIENGSYGLNWLATFASEHGKQLSLPEWALARFCNGHGGGDDPYYVQKMHDWIASHDVAYETYFNDDDNSCRQFAWTSAGFSNASAAYKSLWQGGLGTNAVSTSSTSSSTTASISGTAGLRISWSSARSGDTALNGASFGGRAYVFDVPTEPTSKVVFSVDGQYVRTESSRAYDFGGTGADGQAVAYDFSGHLATGAHTITATETGLDGGTTTRSATFHVQ